MAIETLRPTTGADSGGFSTTNKSYAYDTSTSTRSTSEWTEVGSFSVYSWASSTKTYTALSLILLTEFPVMNTTAVVSYSTDGGTNWTSVRGVTGPDSGTVTNTVTLSPSQDLSLLRVRIYGYAGTPTNQGDIYDVRTEGTYSDVSGFLSAIASSGV